MQRSYSPFVSGKPPAALHSRALLAGLGPRTPHEMLSSMLSGLAFAPRAAEGPCDIYAAGGTPCVAAHSMVRALFGGYDGPLYLVQRASDLASTAVATKSPGGFADSAAQDRFCAGTGCTLVSQSTGWCSGAATEAACHRSRTEGRPCVWAGARCTKGYKFGHGDEPSCPPPAGRLPLAAAASAANIGGGQPARQRVSHFDPRLGATADFVDLHAVLSRLDARVVYLGEDDKAEAPGAAMVAASAGGGTSNTRPVASTLVPRVRIGRRRCQRDLAACRRDVARALGLQFVGPRVALPNDAL